MRSGWRTTTGFCRCRQGHVGSGDVLADWIAADADDFDDKQSDAFLDHLVGVTDVAADFDAERLREDAAHDRDLLRALAAEARTVTRAADPNLAALVDELAAIAADAQTHGIGAQDARDRRKVLIFSYYATRSTGSSSTSTPSPPLTAAPRLSGRIARRSPEAADQAIGTRCCGASLPAPPMRQPGTTATCTTLWLPPMCCPRA